MEILIYIYVEAELWWSSFDDRKFNRSSVIFRPFIRIILFYSYDQAL